MTISKELFLAILSMDAYNCGYGAGISDGLGETDADGNDIDGLGRVGSHIGGASVILDANQPSAQSSGFYALAYTVGEGVEGIAPGTTVISYRGTDNPLLTADPDKGGSDITNGWVLGEGTLNAQSRLAQAFYAKVNPDIFTGHALGGGLAGFVSAITGRQAYLFDHMPFGAGAYLQANENAFDSDGDGGG
ncbi:MAG: hypothetical protein PHX82_16915 [Paracoccaceae bacterium]|nr:hypothetical protein [Paracoccaceae bacterium]